jgi:molybdate transport system substrate-binding protein
VLGFGAVAGVGYGVWRYFQSRSSGSSTTTIVRGSGGGSGGGDSSAISIYAPNGLSKILERVTTAYQQEHPGTTFQFTLGPTGELQSRIKGGQKPDLYIDTKAAVGQLQRKAKPSAAPVDFGHDIVQLAVAHGNPKQVRDLSVFASASPFTTGICARELACGYGGAAALQRAGVNPAPKVVASDVSQLTDGVTRGQIDAVLLFRTQLRSVLTGITTPPLPPATDIRIDYQMAQFRSGGPGNDFITWLQGSPSARKALRDTGMLSYYSP